MPPPPARVSLPRPPSMTLSLPSPVRVSLSAEPTRFSMPVRVSMPAATVFWAAPCSVEVDRHARRGAAAEGVRERGGVVAVAAGQGVVGERSLQEVVALAAVQHGAAGVVGGDRGGHGRRALQRDVQLCRSARPAAAGRRCRGRRPPADADVIGARRWRRCRLMIGVVVVRWCRGRPCRCRWWPARCPRC